MAIAMPIQQDIRRRDRQGMPHAQIARELGVDRGTVARYARQEDCSPQDEKGQEVRAQDGCVRVCDRPMVGGGSDDAAQAAAYGQAGVRPAGGRVRVRWLVQRGAPLREGLA